MGCADGRHYDDSEGPVTSSLPLQVRGTFTLNPPAGQLSGARRREPGPSTRARSLRGGQIWVVRNHRGTAPSASLEAAALLGTSSKRVGVKGPSACSTSSPLPGSWWNRLGQLRRAARLARREPGGRRCWKRIHVTGMSIAALHRSDSHRNGLAAALDHVRCNRTAANAARSGLSGIGRCLERSRCARQARRGTCGYRCRRPRRMACVTLSPASIRQTCQSRQS